MKVIKKLKKLIAHAESARAIGNTAEAAAFAERIQQLLSRHNLSMSEVELHEAEESAIGMEPVPQGIPSVDTWQRALLANLAAINGCHTLEHRAGFQIVVGRRQDRDVVINLYQYFENLGRDLSETYLNERQILSSGIFFASYPIHLLGSDNSRRNSFLLGFVAAICQRLQEINKKSVEESNNSAALVFLGNRQQENQDWIDKNLNVEERTETPINDIDRTAFQRGASVGDSVALTDKTLK